MNEARQVGRRTKCTPELTTLAGDLLKLGLSDADAIEMLPVGRSAFYGWIQRGKAEAERLEQPGARRSKREMVFVEFADAIKGARAARIEALLNNIWDAAAGRGTSTETRSVFGPDGDLRSRTVTEKTAPPVWTASAWLLERLDWARFSQHKMLDPNDWRTAAKADGVDDAAGMRDRELQQIIDSIC